MKITPFKLAMFNLSLIMIFTGWWVLFFVLFAMISLIAFAADSIAGKMLN